MGKTEAELKEEARKKAEEEAAKKNKPVTQEAIDRLYGKLKETEERLQDTTNKLTTAEQEKVGLVGRVNNLEKRVPPAAATDKPLREVFSEGNYPKTEEEWDDLIAESPTYGTDLRLKYSNSRNKFADSQEKSRQKIMEKHPDMYIRDADGKLVLQNGFAQLDMKSEKAKLFIQVAEESGVDVDGVPNILKSVNGPEMVMTTVVTRLKEKEDKLKTDAKAKKDAEEAERQRRVKGGKVIIGGEPPPPPPKVEVKFNSEEERQAAEAAVGAGHFKDLEEYCRVKQDKRIGYGRGGF